MYAATNLPPELLSGPPVATTTVTITSAGTGTLLGCPHARPHWSCCPWCLDPYLPTAAANNGDGERYPSARFPDLDAASAAYWYHGRSLDLARDRRPRIPAHPVGRRRIPRTRAHGRSHRREPGRCSRVRRRRAARGGGPP